MATSGYLVPPEQSPERAELWNMTWRHLDRFLPQLRKELFPETLVKPVKSPTKASAPKVLEVQKENEKSEASGKEGGA
jgi:golgi-specific brefeldin A-resistance guanine nucleotide exchange factor 1